MQLSHIERVMLTNQYKILSLLDPSNAHEYDMVREALVNGYESYYSEALRRQVYEEELSPDESRLVINAMAMYWAMQSSYDRLDDEGKAEIPGGRPNFPGFDGNDETKFAAYTQFVVEKEGRFGHLRFEREPAEDGGVIDGTLDRYNSHWPMVDTYRRRVDRWNTMPDRNSLSADDIRAILEIY